MQITPTVKLSALQDAADGGRAEMSGLRDLVGGTKLRRNAMTWAIRSDEVRRGLWSGRAERSRKPDRPWER